MLSKYNQFKLELLLERINESVIYFSPNFRKLLSKMVDNEIANDLLEVEVTDIKPDITFVDLDSEKDDYLTFTTMKNVAKQLDDGSYKHIKEIENLPKEGDNWEDKESRISIINTIHKHPVLSDLFKKSRNPVRIGKFVNKVLGTTKYNSTQVEEFVNKLRASKEQSGEKFLIVEGDDIAFWYKTENYAEIKGQLGNSCMREKPSSFFEIYVKNPEVCRMLVLLEDDKLIGRALIWKLSYAKSYGKNLEGIVYFMDRQYTTKDSDVDKFRSYAVENGWAYKSNNNHHSLEPITYNDETFNCSMSVDIKDLSYDRYPYMDTFRRFDPSNKSLHNDEEDSSNYEGDYILDHTDGTYREIEAGVWSEWHDRMLSEEDAVWSEWAESYIDRGDSIYVESGSRRNHGWYPDGCDSVTWDGWNDEFIHVDDSVYSDAYGYSIEAGSAVEVIGRIDIDGEPRNYDSNWYHEGDDEITYLGVNIQKMNWFKRLSSEWSAWDDYSYVRSDLFVMNWNNEPIPKIFAIDVYKVTGKKLNNRIDIENITEYLTDFDANILEYHIDKVDKRVMDNFDYHDEIEEILKDLHSKLSSNFDKIKRELKGEGQLRLQFDEDSESDYKAGLEKRKTEILERMSEIESGLFIDFEE